MKLQTQIPLGKAENQIDYDSRLLLLGSCFVENMGKKFDYFKFRQLQNPFGILFHPLAIGNLVERAIQGKPYLETEIFFHDEHWHCFDAHSELSDTSNENLLKRLNEGLQATRKQIRTASHIIITLGTAWGYRHCASDSFVANCHKVPQREFSKELLSIDKISASLNHTVQRIQSINHDIQVIFTVSPVRHLKDGFVENQRSKAHLISAVHGAIAQKVPLGKGQKNVDALGPRTSVRPNSNHPSEAVMMGDDSAPADPSFYYFPSYELMMDELRDYRFYESDMVHPSDLAIDYIWQKFKKVWISEDACNTMEKVDAIQKGLRHRPFHPDSERDRKFRTALKAKMTKISKEYPFMAF